jgi:CheY-like chemotaxis protein
MALVLIAEDEEVLRVLAESILQDHGYSVLTAADGAEALALIEIHDVDLLFTDIHMGETNGLDLAVAAVGQKPGIDVLYTSGVGVTDGTRARFVEGSAFLPKAYRLEDLVAAVAKLIGP